MPRTISLFIGLFICSVSYTVNAQGEPRGVQSGPGSRKPAAASGTSRGSSNDAEENMIVGRIESVERQMTKAETELNQQLSAAQRVRQRGLGENNRDLLKQAEKMELNALDRYEQWINYMDRFGSQLNKSTKSRADTLSQTATKRANSSQQQTSAPRAPTQQRARSTTRGNSQQTRRNPQQTRRYPQQTRRRQQRGTQWRGFFRRN